MNERIDKLESLLVRLTERTDAIAQSMELMAGMQIEAERRMARLVEITTNIGGATDQLIQIIHDHEQRITALES